MKHNINKIKKLWLKIFWFVLLSVMTLNLHSAYSEVVFDSVMYNDFVSEFNFSWTNTQKDYLDSFIIWSWPGQLGFSYDFIDYSSYNKWFSFSKMTEEDFEYFKSVYSLAEKYNSVSLLDNFSSEDQQNLEGIFWGNIDFTWSTLVQAKDAYYLFLKEDYERFELDLEKIGSWLTTLDYMDSKMTRSWTWIWVNIFCFKNFWVSLDDNWVYCNHSEFKNKIDWKKKEVSSLKSQILTAMIWIKKQILANWAWDFWDVIWVCWPWETYDFVNNICVLAPRWYWNNWDYLYARVCQNSPDNATLVSYTQNWVRAIECPYEVEQCDSSWYWWVEDNKLECTRSCAFWSSFVNCDINDSKYVWRTWNWSNCIEEPSWLRDLWYWRIIRDVSCYEKVWQNEVLVANENCNAWDKPEDHFYCRISSWNCVQRDADWTTCLQVNRWGD